MILHLGHIFFTEGRTFMPYSTLLGSSRKGAVLHSMLGLRPSVNDHS